MTSRLSKGQESLYVIHDLAPESDAYNFVYSARIRSAVDCAALTATIDVLVDRHAALRTSFRTSNGELRREVLDQVSVGLDLVDSSGWSEDDLVDRVRAEGSRPFDLGDAPLVRAVLFTAGDDDHVLLLAFHHMVMDAWSVTVLLDEFSQVYRALRQGETATLPRLSAGYDDFVTWQERVLAEGATHAAYWAERLGDAPTALALPTDRPRPLVCRYRGASHAFALGPDTTALLRSVAADAGATLFVVLLAGYQALLSRYTGQEDFLVSTPTTGRGRPEFAPVVGYFVNPVLVRADLTGRPGFRDLVARVREEAIRALAHQDYPFAAVVAEHQVERDPSRSPLAQAMFTFQQARRPEMARFFTPGAGGSAVDLGGLLVEPFAIAQQAGQVDLALDMIEIDGCLHGTVKYSADLFDADFGARVAEHFQTLVEAGAAAPDRPVATLPLMRAEDQAALLGSRAVLATDSLLAMFDACAENSPHSVAVVDDGSTLTYRELAERSSRIAGGLRARGVEPGALVGVRLPRSADMVAVLLGVLRAGAAYVPLDPDYPAPRIEAILADARPVLVVGDSVGVPELLDATGSRPPCAAPAATDRAYVIYTSGSTGVPKGVEVSHGSLANLLVSFAEELEVAQEDTLLAVTTISFDIAALELFLPLIRGGRVVVVSRETVVEGVRLARAVDRFAPTLMQATPVTWQMLVDAGWQGSARLTALCGGEALSRALADRLRPLCDVLWNVYGPTETTIWSMAGRVGDGTRAPALGRPVRGTQVYVLDQHGNAVPPGVEGELHIGGAGVAIGYLRRPEETDRAFLLAPWHPADPTRIYRTGDRVRYRANGDVEYLGRRDGQVKIRGHRIETGEVEAVLGAHPDVVSAAVVVRGVPARLVAYAQPRTGARTDSGALRRYLLERLPAPMVPDTVVPVDPMPTTPNGKVDRAALPDRPATEAAAHHVAPRTTRERVLAAIWADLLGVDEVGVMDDFFVLGGDSVHAVRMVSRAAEQGLALTTRQVFLSPTVADLAAAAGDTAPAVPRHGSASGTDESFPLSAVQAGFLVESLTARRPGHYVQQVGWTFRGAVDVSALRDAWQRVVDEHPVLRAEVEWEDVPAARYRVRPTAEVPFEVLDWRTAADVEARWRQLLDRDRQRGFDLSESPLMRVTLVLLDGDEYRHLWTYHHVILDGWSVPIALRGVFAAYESGEVPAASKSPADYIRWLEGQNAAESEAFWAGVLAGAVPTGCLPISPRDGVDPGELGEVTVRIDAREITGFAKRIGVTLATVVHAAWALVLGRATGRDEVVFGTTVSGRPDTLPGADDMVGLFVNTLPLRVRLDRANDPAGWLKDLQRQHAELWQHAHLSPQRLRRLARLEPGTALFETMVAVENYPLRGLESSVTATDFFAVDRNHPFALLVLPGAELSLRIVHDTARFERGEVERVLDRLRAALEELMSEPVALPAAPESTDLERVLIDIWAELLRLDAEGITPDDDFFALGGDSLLSLQLVNLAKRAGLDLTPRQVFDHPTVAEMAAAASSARSVEVSPHVGDDGPVPLSPAQVRFSAAPNRHPHIWNIAHLFSVPRLDPTRLARAFEALVERHEALRLRRTGGSQTVVPAVGDAPFHRVPLDHLPPGARSAAVEAHCAALQGSLDLQDGPLVRLVLFDLGPVEPNRLLFVVHHTVTDSLSAQILLEDLIDAYEQSGGVIRLPATTATIGAWARCLVERAQSAELLSELPYWVDEARHRCAKLPVDLPGIHTGASSRVVELELPEEQTAALLRDVPATYRVRTLDVLLTALAATLSAETGDERVLIDLETNSRDVGGSEIDLSRTVGWFVHFAPLLLSTRASLTWGDRLRDVAAQVGAVPNGGVGHGLLRYLRDDPETSRRLAAMPTPQVVFNYKGQHAAQGERVLARAGFTRAPEHVGTTSSPSIEHPHHVQVNVSVSGERLRIEWFYSDRVHLPGTARRMVRRFADALGALAELRSPGKQVAVSSSQRWMRTHDHRSLNLHTVMRWRDPLDLAAFERSLNGLLARHEALSTVFPLRDGEVTARVLHGVDVPVELLDCREMAEEAVWDLAGEVVRRPFARPDAELLIRAAVLQGATDCLVVLVVHHLNADGWSMSVLVEELLTRYEIEVGDGRGPLPPPPPPYSAWVRDGGGAADGALEHWREQLAGAKPLFGGTNEVSLPTTSLPFEIPEALSSALRELDRCSGSTVQMVLLTAFFLALAEVTGRAEVVAGVSVANRADPAFERSVGFFANTLWLRVDFTGKIAPSSQLAEVRGAYLDGLAHPVAVEDLFSAGLDFNQALFSFVGMPQNHTGVLVDVLPVSLTEPRQRKDLFLTIVDDGRTQRGLLRHTDRYFPPERAAVFVDSYRRALARLREVAGP